MTNNGINVSEAARFKDLIACGHIRPLYKSEDRKFIVQQAIEILKPYSRKFKAIAIQGYSSALIAPIIAERMRKNLIIVRKPSEQRHSRFDVEGVAGQTYVFIDDLIDSGNTVRRVYTQVRDLLGGKMFGVYCFNDGCISDKGPFGWSKKREKLDECTDTRVLLLNPDPRIEENCTEPALTIA